MTYQLVQLPVPKGCRCAMYIVYRTKLTEKIILEDTYEIQSIRYCGRNFSKKFRHMIFMFIIQKSYKICIINFSNF